MRPAEIVSTDPLPTPISTRSYTAPGNASNTHAASNPKTSHVLALRRHTRYRTFTRMKLKNAPREKVSTSATTTTTIDTSNASLNPELFDSAQVNSSSA